MCTTVGRRDIIDEADKSITIVIFLILKGDLYLDVIEIFIHIEYLISDRLDSTVQVVDIRLYPSFEEKSIGRARELIRKCHSDTLREVCLLTQTCTDSIIVEYYGREHRRIWPETGDSTVPSRLLSCISDLPIRYSSLIWLSIYLPIFMHPDLHLVWESIHYRGTDSVETTWDLVPALRSSELTTSMEHRHDCLKRRLSRLWMDIDRDTTSIIFDRDRSIGVHIHEDMLRMSCHRLIDRVIDDLPDEMMETLFIGLTDIHSWSFSDGLESFENLDLTGVVGHFWEIRF